MKLSLKYLILFVALISVILTLFSSISSGHQMNKQTLTNNTLETNRVYAQKLANITDVIFNMTLQTLELSSNDIVEYMQDQDDAAELLLEEADRLKNQTNIFNSVIIAAANGEILATSPQTIDVIGKMLDSEGGKQALSEQKPLISDPYLSITGRLIIFISYPIFDENNHYIGLVGGSLYLKEKNILNDILGEHYYQDGSYVYVVDKHGRIIYHQDESRINELVSQNPVVKQLMLQQSGAVAVTNTKNVDMLAGYAYVESAGWGIVSQRPTNIALAPSQDMINEMIIKSLPYLLLSFVIIAFISQLIARPIQKLADFAQSSTVNNEKEGMEKVKAWYYEAIHLKKALTYSLAFFHERVDFFTYQSNTDPLTKLTNRRTLDEKSQKWIEHKTPFSIIVIDIDHFKRVNDTFGHATGDEVLKFLADKLREVAREGDICCRFGGEEFIMLLQNTQQNEALLIAEKLRKLVESEVSPSGESITISAGIASYPACADDAKALFEIADQCLYEAKNTGRNKCVAKQTPQ